MRLQEPYTVLRFYYMNIFHVLNRGIDGRKLFLDSQDYVRFIHNLYEFNDTAPAVESTRRSRDLGVANAGHRKSHIRERLVEIHGWVLMKDHYHLLLSELVDGGLVKFITKINIGYAKYYNERYGRHGHLYQGKTKKTLIENEAHFLYILHYLHLNPLDYLPSAENWRIRDKGTIKSTKEALEYLKGYRWSSYLDYSGNKNFPSILTKDLFEDVPGAYQKTIEEYLKDAELLASSDFPLE
jgi:putative transposase